MEIQIQPSKWRDMLLDFRYGNSLFVILILNCVACAFLIIVNIVADTSSVNHNIMSALTITTAIIVVLCKRFMLDHKRDEEFKMMDLYKEHKIDIESRNFGVQYRIVVTDRVSHPLYKIECYTMHNSASGEPYWVTVENPVGKGCYYMKGIEDENYAMFVYRWYLTAKPINVKDSVIANQRPQHSRLLSLPAPSIPEEDKKQSGAGVTTEELNRAVESFRAALLGSIMTHSHKKTPNQLRELYDGVEEAVKGKSFSRIDEIEKELKEKYNEIQKKQEDDWSDY